MLIYWDMVFMSTKCIIYEILHTLVINANVTLWENENIKGGGSNQITCSHGNKAGEDGILENKDEDISGLQHWTLAASSEPCCDLCWVFLFNLTQF